MSVSSNSQLSINKLITLPEDLDVIKLENFKKGGFLDILQLKKNIERAEVVFNISEDFSFNEFILSVSAKMDKNDTLCLFAEVEGKRYYLGNFSPAGSTSFSKEEGSIKVDVDVLKIKSDKLSSIRGGIIFFNRSNKDASVKLLNIVLTDTTKKNTYRRFVPPKPIKLAVPKISQMVQQVNYNQDICSPTSLSMVLNYYGVKIDTVSVACSVYDEGASIYGNWVFNTAYASYLGFYAFVSRINSFELLYKILRCGIPVIASISFEAGELKNAPLKKTKGHLVVIKGIDKDGNIVVNDPASPKEETVERVYRQSEFFKAWIDNKYGTSYIVADEKRIKDVIKIFKEER